MIQEKELLVRQALNEVKDPEIPTLSIVELGMVYSVEAGEEEVRVRLMPTFVGCPALDIIRRDVENKVQSATGIPVKVDYVLDEPWTTERITPEGREHLASFGIAPPMAEWWEKPPCPFCGAPETEVENLFGPTACRAIYYCTRCRQPFEGFKPV
ncbi:1,2-phenylacetyl-CoA epoxidase subunit PaaD [Kyrpidia tusciae]|uniref:Phenylacetate-CoA oxygenase, PaaJ subunit n=1 Tax=Kyrpidia tusciae (strain DSM 2912 / NBRC 15312 / T2) TaxID=562970 RepID=D5WXP1_KYRT2|nr:1,2-phenylacetyl-CoA epoxidase subunit PaaD [Kyrpidia tusciae]ADG05962.1 phenylacetate-CoA oxygenase, PaaJ subunit [Kyrpidia tusciae DSM 2912]